MSLEFHTLCVCVCLLSYICFVFRVGVSEFNEWSINSIFKVFREKQFFFNIYLFGCAGS